MATKEFLRKMRQKYHLGEYSKKSINKTYASVSKPSKPKRIKRKRTRGVFMAKRRRTSKRGNSFGGGNKLMNGFIQPKGIIAKALLGIAVSELSDSFAPQMVPYQGALLAGLVSGVPGAAAAYGINTLQGKNVKNVGNAVTYGNY
jgi:hypothetical protein